MVRLSFLLEDIVGCLSFQNLTIGVLNGRDCGVRSLCVALNTLHTLVIRVLIAANLTGRINF